MLKLRNIFSFTKPSSSNHFISSFLIARDKSYSKHSESSATVITKSDEDQKKQFEAEIPIEQLRVRFSRSPGPGGQNVNKVNTKVDVRFNVESADWIPNWIKEKLLEKESNRINTEGDFVIQSSKYRNQQQNLQDSVEKIQNILQQVSYIPKETSKEKKQKIAQMMKVANERRLKDKRIRSQRKQGRYDCD